MSKREVEDEFYTIVTDLVSQLHLNRATEQKDLVSAIMKKFRSLKVNDNVRININDIKPRK
jgi:hypothetical protein